MGTHRVGSQSARTIQNADVINNFSAPAPVDNTERGLEALANLDYAAARASFDEAVRRSNYRDADILFYRALSKLGGVRPLRHAKETVVDVMEELSRAGGNSSALTLKALVAEDYAQSWRRREKLPRAALDVIGAVPAERAGDIVRHVPAPESQIWQILHSRSV